jgi:hypothetical protein
MVERICPTCQHANPLDDRFCGKCGAALERQLPVRRADAALTLAGRQLPVSWQQVGKTLAISAAALAAEAGLAWLRRRVELGSATPTTALAKTTPETLTRTSPAQSQSAAHIVTIVSRRVVEIWDSGDGNRRIVEQNFWRRIDEG